MTEFMKNSSEIGPHPLEQMLLLSNFHLEKAEDPMLQLNTINEQI